MKSKKEIGRMNLNDIYRMYFKVCVKNTKAREELKEEVSHKNVIIRRKNELVDEKKELEQEIYLLKQELANTKHDLTESRDLGYDKDREIQIKEEEIADLKAGVVGLVKKLK